MTKDQPVGISLRRLIADIARMGRLLEHCLVLRGYLGSRLTRAHRIREEAMKVFRWNMAESKGMYRYGTIAVGAGQLLDRSQSGRFRGTDEAAVCSQYCSSNPSASVPLTSTPTLLYESLRHTPSFSKFQGHYNHGTQFAMTTWRNASAPLASFLTSVDHSVADAAQVLYNKARSKTRRGSGHELPPEIEGNVTAMVAGRV